MMPFLNQGKLNAYFLFLVIIVSGGCRKDNSAFLEDTVPEVSNCLVAERRSEDGKTITTSTFNTDSLLTEITTKKEGQVLAASYLVEESPGQFLNFKGSKDPEDAVSRIYLNDDGTVSKEVEVFLNDDGISYSEDPDYQMIFTYKTNKLLEKIESTLEDDGIYDFEYDDKNRIKKITIHDGEGTTFFVYDNFTYDEHTKTDNMVTLVLFDSITSYLIPSLRNVYIKGYTISSPLDPALGKTVSVDYQFTDNKLTAMTQKITAPDGSVAESTETIVLNCK